MIRGSIPAWAGSQGVKNLTCYSLWGRDIKWSLRGLSYRDGKEPLVSQHSTDLTHQQPIWYLQLVGQGMHVERTSSLLGPSPVAANVR